MESFRIEYVPPDRGREALSLTRLRMGPAMLGVGGCRTPEGLRPATAAAAAAAAETSPDGDNPGSIKLGFITILES